MRTPGPWFADGNKLCATAEGHTLVLAEFYDDMASGEGEAQANLQSSAAVPDLIEALADLVDKCMAVVEGFSEESFPSNYTSVLNDNLLCIKQSVNDAATALSKAGETL